MVSQFAIVGFGRMGRALAGGLVSNGFDLAAVASRSYVARAAALDRYPGTIATTDLADVARLADTIALTVPDDAIEACTRALARSGVLGAEHIVIHFSGCHGLEVLDAAADVGAARAALHPAMTYSGSERDVERIAAPYAVTTDERVRAKCFELVKMLGGTPFWMPPEQRAIYHAALIFGANNIISLVAGAFEILRAGSDVDPTALLGPVFQACLDNVLANGSTALTGPVRRGDIGTLQAHTEAVAEAVPSMSGAYQALTAYTYGLAERHQLIEVDSARRVADFLAGLDDPRSVVQAVS